MKIRVFLAAVISDTAFLWTCVFFYAFPLGWTLFSSAPLPTAGLTGLTKLSIGIPVFLSVLVSALIASVPKVRNPDRLFAAGGFLLAVSLGLMFYVSNSGFVAAMFLSGFFFRLGQRYRHREDLHAPILARICLGRQTPDRLFSMQPDEIVVELSATELLFRNPFYSPALASRFSLAALKSIEIVGPLGRRYVRCAQVDGSRPEVGPFQFEASAEARLASWLADKLPDTVTVQLREPAHFFETIRADY